MIVDNIYIKRAFKIFLFWAAITLIAIIAFYLFGPTEETLKEFVGNLDSNSPVKDRVGLDKVWGFILNNGFLVPLQMTLIAIIPIPFLYHANMLSTVLTLAFLVGMISKITLYEGIAMSVAALPHFTLEILGFSFVLSGLYNVNKAILRKVANVFRSKKKENISFLEAFKQFLKIYLVYALPLIIIAAFVETYVADFILRLLT